MISEEILVLAALVLILLAMAALATTSVMQGHKRLKKFESRINEVVAPGTAPANVDRGGAVADAHRHARRTDQGKSRCTSSASICASRKPIRSNGGWCRLWLWH